MSEMALYLWDARQRMAAFDSLPASLRARLDTAVTIPDTQTVLALYRDAVAQMGAKRAEKWMLRSIDAWVIQKTGNVAPLNRPPRRPARLRTPDGLKLAPAVPTVVS